MLKAEYRSRGPEPEAVIEAVEFELPEIAGDEVRLELVASPINPSDILTLKGEYGMLPPLPAVAGSEGIAKVIDKGNEVSNVDIGTHVLMAKGQDVWATHFNAKAAELTPMPDSVDPLQMSMLGVNPPTASLLLSEFVDLKPGDWVIQNVANSGVGTFLIQLAKLKGIKTINVVRRESLIEPLKALGGDVVVVDSDNLSEDVAKACDQAPVKLGIDAVGGGATERIAQTLSQGATLVNYGAMSGEAPVISPASLIFNHITLTGFWLMRWLQTADSATQQALYGELAGHLAKGEIATPVDKTFAIADVKEAVAYANQPERKGKVLLTP